MKEIKTFLLPAIILFFLNSGISFAQLQPFGLQGKVVNDLKNVGAILYAATDSGVYKRVTADSDWTFLGPENINVTSLSTFDLGAAFMANIIIAGTEPSYFQGDSVLIYTALDRPGYEISWMPNDSCIDKNEISRIYSIYGYPLYGAILAGGEGKFYRREGGSGCFEKLIDSVGALNTIEVHPVTGNIWIGGETGIFASFIARSTDSGDTWITSYPDLGGDNACNSIAFDIIDTNIIFAGMEGAVIKSTDAGSSWITTSLNNTPYYFTALEYNSFTGTLYAAGSTNENRPGFFWSGNKGDTWQSLPLTDSLTYRGISSIALLPAAAPENYNVYAGTKGSGIFQFQNPTGTNEEEQIVTGYALKQNYPNPFNSRTMIEFSLLKGENVKLRILNILGKEIALLFSGYLPEGNHKVAWDAGSIPSGVYFYTIEAGTFRNTKRMLLIK